MVNHYHLAVIALRYRCAILVIKINYYRKITTLEIAGVLLKAAFKLSPVLKRKYDKSVLRAASPFFT